MEVFERVSANCLASELGGNAGVELSETEAWLTRHVRWQQAASGPDDLIGASHWYPHHIFSNPSATPEINIRRWDDIQALRYVSELHCIRLNHTEIVSSIIATETSPPMTVSHHDGF